MEAENTFLTPDLDRELLYFLEMDQKNDLIAALKDLHPADTAKFIERLSPKDRQYFFATVKGNLDPEVLAEIHHDILESVLENLPTPDLVRAIKRLDSDDAVAVLEDLSEEQQQSILKSINPIDRKKILESLNFEPDTAGRIMQSEVAVMLDTATVSDAHSYLKKTKHLPDIFFELYLVDAEYSFKGAIRLCDLIQCKDTSLPLKYLARSRSVVIATMDQEEVGYIFKKYALVSAPVVNEEGHLLGMITADDVLHIIDEEADKAFRYLGGVMETSLEAGTLRTSYMRLRWLFVTFINTLIASSVIYQFEAVLAKYVALAILMPIVAAMGGNAGMQVVTVTVRALATHQLDLNYDGFYGVLKKIVSKEVLIGLINGTFFALFLATLAAFWFNDPRLGGILAGAMIFNVVWAGFAGSFLPLIINRLGFDPAISAGPFLTTTTDVMGFTVFLGLAKLFLVG